ncbi:hypothetical protein EVAR_40668_1 [Eumeta japonica]|uniref:Uncharacterized protein n=1 Tax=Eumeta variegata TaxID=151549 RepID=A0A4C1X6Z7_EUMVA|nr:hypothetical protein EVAR_40668_1 [Eumeta japonica]
MVIVIALFITVVSSFRSVLDHNGEFLRSKFLILNLNYCWKWKAVLRQRRRWRYVPAAGGGKCESPPPKIAGGRGRRPSGGRRESMLSGSRDAAAARGVAPRVQREHRHGTVGSVVAVRARDAPPCRCDTATCPATSSRHRSPSAAGTATRGRYAFGECRVVTGRPPAARAAAWLDAVVTGGRRQLPDAAPHRRRPRCGITPARSSPVIPLPGSRRVVYYVCPSVYSPSSSSEVGEENRLSL